MKPKKIKGLLGLQQLLLIIVIFSNFWIYKIFNTNFFIAVDLILITQAIYWIIYFFPKKDFKFINKIVLSIIFLTAFLFLIMNLLLIGFDRNIFTTSPNDLSKLNSRHAYYSENLGKIFTNKFSLSFYKNYSIPMYKISDNFFNSLDINYYFFEGHPREKSYLANFPKYPFFLVIFFMIGIVRIIFLKLWLMGLYVIIATIIQTFLIQNYLLGPIIFFPFITLTIFYGFEYLIKKIIK